VKQVMEGYAYIMTHPGIPCVLWEHAFDWGLGDDIKALVELRRRNGIVRNSAIEILCADDDMCAPAAAPVVRAGRLCTGDLHRVTWTLSGAWRGSHATE
jgi:hypothetical protein